MIKVIIADDHPAIRNAWQLFLSSFNNISVLAVCSSGKEVIKKVAELLPDIILMDINMTDISGIDATKRIMSQTPGMKVIGVSSHSSPLYISKMMDAGAKGYVIKHNVSDQLINAIEEVYKGNIYIGKDKL